MIPIITETLLTSFIPIRSLGVAWFEYSVRRCRSNIDRFKYEPFGPMLRLNGSLKPLFNRRIWPQLRFTNTKLENRTYFQATFSSIMSVVSFQTASMKVLPQDWGVVIFHQIFDHRYWKTIAWGYHLSSRVAQWKRAGPITQRSVDRNHALLPFSSVLFVSSYRSHRGRYLQQIILQVEPRNQSSGYRNGWSS